MNAPHTTTRLLWISKTMSDLPPITVCIPTYTDLERGINRHELVRDTVLRLRQNLRYNGLITYLISADGLMPPDDLFAAYDIQPGELSIVRGPSKGFGANLNNLLAGVTTDLIFQIDDDIELLQPLYLEGPARKLMEDETAGWVRFMWIGCHNYIADLIGEYWYVRWDSREHYVPSCRAHLKHKRFHEYFGKYPEGLATGATEDGFCHQCKRKYDETKEGPRMLVPLIGVLPDEAWWHRGIVRT